MFLIKLNYQRLALIKLIWFSLLFLVKSDNNGIRDALSGADIFIHSHPLSTLSSTFTNFQGWAILSKKLSTADISEFFKLSANYRYRIFGIWELSKNYRYRKLHPILSDKHNWKHCSKNKKGTTMINRKAACCQRLLVQQSQHRDSAMVLDIKSVVRSTTCEHVKQRYMQRLRHWRGYCGIKVLILTRLGLYLRVFVQNWYLMTFDAISAFLMFFGAFLILFCAFLTPFCAFLTQFCAFLTPIFAFLTQFCAFLLRNLILEKIYRKNYRKPIYRPFSNYRANYRYRFNTSSNYRWFQGIIGKVIVIEIWR